jgi:hypothetical protein
LAGSSGPTAEKRRITVKLSFYHITSGALLALAVSLMSAPKVQGQVIEACYVQKTGAIYIIGQPGAPQECQKPGKHVQINWNLLGPPGPQGPKGDAGAQDPPGLSEYVSNFTLGNWDSTSPKTVEASCPEGYVVLGGGANVTPETNIPPVAITRSLGINNPIEGLPRWIATAQEIGDFSGSWRLVAIVYCGLVSS